MPEKCFNHHSSNNTVNMTLARLVAVVAAYNYLQHLKLSFRLFSHCLHVNLEYCFIVRYPARNACVQNLNPANNIQIYKMVLITTFPTSKVLRRKVELHILQVLSVLHIILYCEQMVHSCLFTG